MPKYAAIALKSPPILKLVINILYPELHVVWYDSGWFHASSGQDKNDKQTNKPAVIYLELHGSTKSAKPSQWKCIIAAFLSLFLKSLAWITLKICLLQPL